MNSNSENSTILSGTFDCEEFWRDKDLAKLPAIEDKQAGNIVMAMDELLFVLCNPNDTLITRFKMDQVHQQYLKEIGFNFHTGYLFDNYCHLDEVRRKNVCNLILESDIIENFMGDKEAEYSPFSVTPESKAVSERLKLNFNSPSIEVIKKVNSKIYSSGINQRMEMLNTSDIVSSARELRKIGEDYLTKSHFLIKDIFGVSGKGNLLITSSNILDRIVNYIEMQEKRGKKVLFIVEPFLQRDFDFSCQLFIHTDGRVDIISVQKLNNNNFAYQGSFTAENGFLEFLEEQGYFDIIRRVAKQLYQDDYFGHACIDSMILKSGEIIPVIEINARKSMSLIKHYIDRYVSDYSLKCSFTYFSLHFRRFIDYEEFIEKMAAEGILYSPGEKCGIIPLSSNTLLINQKELMCRGNIKDVKGRIYVAFAFENNEQQNILNNNMLHFLEENSMHVYQ